MTATDNAGNAGQGEADATTANAVTKYYYFGGKRVAVRGPDAAVQWLHGDHLGSTSLTTDQNGGEVARQLYYPFGEVRWSSETPLPTDFQFTGQRNAGTIGLYDYRARFYDPYLGRFISADTIVPNPSVPQDLNRYTYSRNSPLKYTDPSGHLAQGEDDTGDVDLTLELLILRSPADYYWYLHNTHSQWEVFGFAAVGLAGASFAMGVVAGVTPEAVTSWVLTHPVEAKLLKAAGEEVAEAVITGTPIDPRNIVLDYMTEFGDDALPRREEIFDESVVYPRGQGASTGPVPEGYVPVTRWVNEAEADLWIANEGVSIPGEVGGMSGRVYVTLPDAPQPGGTGPVRIDFHVRTDSLQVAGRHDWRQILQPASNMPIYNVSITYPAQ